MTNKESPGRSAVLFFQKKDDDEMGASTKSLSIIQLRLEIDVFPFAVTAYRAGDAQLLSEGLRKEFLNP